MLLLRSRHFQNTELHAAQNPDLVVMHLQHGRGAVPGVTASAISAPLLCSKDTTWQHALYG